MWFSAIRARLSTFPRAVVVAVAAFFLIPAGVALAHICWGYSGLAATNPQPWTTGCFEGDALHPPGSTAGQVIGHEHRNWHCTNPVVPTEAYGRAFLAFHRQFILDFDNYRVANGYPRLEYWDPFPDVLVPGNDETPGTAFTHCSDANMPDPGDNIRPANTTCPGCDNLPAAYIGNNLADFTTLGELGQNLDIGPNAWHGSYHNAVDDLGCDDIGGFLHTSRDPAFWMAHKKLDEIARDWQSLQATDTVIVIDRSGSMDDNCSSTTPPPGESPCAINDAREAARTFANIVLDVRMDGGSPAAQQHRIGLVSFANSSSNDLGLTAANGIVTDDGIDNTPFETTLAGISTGGGTSIAAGIREAISILNGIADPNPQQAILVLTDGKENVSPCLGGNSPSSCTPSGPGETLTMAEVGDILVVAVGFGPGAEEANLRDVAERHGGIFVAEANVDDALSLQKFFVTAFGEIYDAGVSADPRGVLPAGQMASDLFPIEVSGSDDRISLVLGWQPPGPDTDPPVVSIAQPKAQQTFTGRCFVLSGNISDASALADVRASISQPGQSGAFFPVDFSGDPPSFTFGSSDEVCGLIPGSNTVTVSAEDIHGNVGQASVQVVRVIGATSNASLNGPAQESILQPVRYLAGSSYSVGSDLPGQQQINSCQLQLELYTPSGDLVDRSAIGVEAGQGLRHDFIHVSLPYDGQTTGTWQGRIVRPSPNDAACGAQDYFYSVLVKGFGRVTPFVSLPKIVVGQPIHAAFRISESNWPLDGYDEVKAEVMLTRPNGQSETYSLFDDGTNGDKMPDNHIWSAELSNPASAPGPHHLRGRFLLTQNGSTVMREAEYTIVVEREPEQCTTVISTGYINAFQWHKPQPGQIIPIDEVACIRNRCAAETQYEISISDSLGWLKTLDANTGAIADLPESFRSDRVEPFGYRCFGTGTSQDDQGGGIPIVSVIPADANPGDMSTISVLVRDLEQNQDAEPVTTETTIQVFPPLDCNNNGVDDAEEIQQGLEPDEDRNGVPDICEPARIFGQGMADLSIFVNKDIVGTTLIYSVTVMNLGPETATGVQLTDMLPAGVIFVSAEPQQGTCSHTSGVVSCDLGTLEDRATVETIIKAEPAVSGPLIHSATIDADTTDTVLGNDRVSDAQSWIRTLLPYITSNTDNMSLMNQEVAGAMPGMHHSNANNSMVGRELPATLDTATTRTSQSGLYVVSILESVDDVVVNSMQSWTLHVETKDGDPVEQAIFAVEGGMPQHGHGLPTAPQVTENLGNGDYRVEGLRFHMAGWWELTFVIDAGAIQDRVTFNLMLK